MYFLRIGSGNGYITFPSLQAAAGVGEGAVGELPVGAEEDGVGVCPFANEAVADDDPVGGGGQWGEVEDEVAFCLAGDGDGGAHGAGGVGGEAGGGAAGVVDAVPEVAVGGFVEDAGTGVEPEGAVAGLLYALPEEEGGVGGCAAGEEFPGVGCGIGCGGALAGECGGVDVDASAAGGGVFPDGESLGEGVGGGKEGAKGGVLPFDEGAVAADGEVRKGAEVEGVFAVGEVEAEEKEDVGDGDGGETQHWPGDVAGEEPGESGQ